MSTGPIDYLKQIDIIDEWGSVLVNIILKGLSIDAINNIKAKAKEELDNLFVGADAYFFLLLNKGFKEELRDIVQFKLIKVNDKTRRWDYSFNQIVKELPILENAYQAAVSNMKSFIPFIYIFVFLEKKTGFLSPLEIYNEREITYFGVSLLDLIKQTLANTDRELAQLEEILNRLWRTKRRAEMEERVFNLLQIENKAIGRVSCYSPPEGELTVFQLRAKFDDIVPQIPAAEREYLEALTLENQFYSGQIETAYPIQYALFDVPPQPDRPTSEDIKIKAEQANPIMENRGFSEKESYCLRRLQMLDEQKEIEVTNIAKYNAGDCKADFQCTGRDELGCSQWRIVPKAGEDPFFCKHLANVFSTARRNISILISKKYPDDLEKDLLPMPTFEPPSQRQRDELLLSQKENECANLTGIDVIDCRIELDDMIDAFNVTYAELIPTEKEKIRVDISANFTELDRNSLLISKAEALGQVPDPSIVQKADEIRPILSIKFDAHRTVYGVLPRLYLLEGEFVPTEDIEQAMEYNRIVVSKLAGSDSAVIETIVREDRTFASVYNERLHYQWYLDSPRTENFKDWKEKEAQARVAVSRFNPKVKAFIKKWGVQPDYGGETRDFEVVQRDWGKTPPYDYLGV